MKKCMGIKVSSGIKAGRIAMNHNRGLIKVSSGVKAGRIATNHNRTLLA